MCCEIVGRDSSQSYENESNKQWSMEEEEAGHTRAHTHTENRGNETCECRSDDMYKRQGEESRSEKRRGKLEPVCIVHKVEQNESTSMK